MSEFLERSASEVEISGFDDQMKSDLMELVRLLDSMGCWHGKDQFKMGWALRRLLRQEPLSPLTGDDDEWIDRSDRGIDNMWWQNKRCTNVFKTRDGRAWYSMAVGFVQPDGSVEFNDRSHGHIEFPYSPVTRHVEVEATT